MKIRVERIFKISMGIFNENYYAKTYITHLTEAIIQNVLWQLF